MAVGAVDSARTQIVLGRIRQSDVSTRTVIPNPRRPEFPPFARIAESIGTSRKEPALHAHHSEEIALYVLEGSVEHLGGDGGRSALRQGTVLLATAGAELRHGLTVDSGRTARWFSVVTSLSPSSAQSTVSVAAVDSMGGVPGPEGAVVRHLIGADGALPSPAGSFLKQVEFLESGTAFLSLGAARRGFVYVLRGEGHVHDHPISAGQSALLEPQAGVALGGRPGFMAIFGSAPFSAPTPAVTGSR